MRIRPLCWDWLCVACRARYELRNNLLNARCAKPKYARCNVGPSTAASLGFVYWLFRTVCGADLLTSSCARSFCRSAVTASICFCKRAMIASCSSIRRCALRNSLSNIAFTASERTEFPAEVLKKFENFSETTESRWTKSVVSVSVFVIVFLKAERVVVLGFPDVLRNRRSEALKNL